MALNLEGLSTFTETQSEGVPAPAFFEETTTASGNSNSFLSE